MDRAILSRHLELAEEHVKLGLQHLRNQREIVVHLERGGHDTFRALELLSTFEGMQKAHEADRDRLVKALKALKPEAE